MAASPGEVLWVAALCGFSRGKKIVLRQVQTWITGLSWRGHAWRHTYVSPTPLTPGPRKAAHAFVGTPFG